MSIAETIPPMPKPDELQDAVIRNLDALDAPQEDDGRWKITDEGGADWALRKLAKVRQQTITVQAQVTRQLNAIDEAIAPFREPVLVWQDEQTDRLAREQQHWEAILIEYHRSVLAEDDDAISIKLAHGVLSSRKQPDKWDFDDKTIIAWAADNAPEFVRVKEEVDKALIKKTVVAGLNGEVAMPADETHVPGISVTVGERRFEVSTEAGPQ